MASQRPNIVLILADDMSDNLPWANASNTPFRLFKHWVHEGGMATPLLVHAPGRAAAAVVHEPCHVADITPTCLEAAGVADPLERDGRPTLPLEGRSLLPLIDEIEKRFEGALFWEHEGNKAVRMGPWKLVRKYPGPWEHLEPKPGSDSMAWMTGA